MVSISKVSEYFSMIFYKTLKYDLNLSKKTCVVFTLLVKYVKCKSLCRALVLKLTH